MSELDVLVVGGGISGLASAHCLAHSGLTVEVWEGAERVGGKIRTLSKQGYRLDSAASMVMNFRSQLDQFLNSAGLEASKRERAPGCKRYVLDSGRLYEAPSSFTDLLRTPLFSTAGKLRLLAEPLMPRSCNPHESVAEFVTRRLGKEFLDKVFEPYVAGPLANDVNRAEALSAMPKLAALEKRYGSLALGALVRKTWCRGSAARPEVFSFAGGMGTLVETLASQGGFRVRNQLHANEVWPVNGGWMVRGMRGDTPHTKFCRQLILSTPPEATANLVSGLDSELARLLRAIEYAPVNVVHTGFRRSDIRHPLNGSGFLVPRTSGFAPNGCLWISSLFPDHAPEGRVLLSSYLGGARNPAAAEWNADRSLDAVMQMLRVLLGIKVNPDMLHIATHARALPLYHGAYSQRLAAIDQRLAVLPGLFLEANYKGGVSIRDRILCAEAVARRILRQRQQLSTVSAAIQIPGIAPGIIPVSATPR
jgi:oxygen-dependent protoporphyrinogen oxidase